MIIHWIFFICRSKVSTTKLYASALLEPIANVEECLQKKKIKTVSITLLISSRKYLPTPKTEIAKHRRNVKKVTYYLL